MCYDIDETTVASRDHAWTRTSPRSTVLWNDDSDRSAGSCTTSSTTHTHTHTSRHVSRDTHVTWHVTSCVYQQIMPSSDHITFPDFSSRCRQRISIYSLTLRSALVISC